MIKLIVTDPCSFPNFRWRNSSILLADACQRFASFLAHFRVVGFGNFFQATNDIGPVGFAADQAQGIGRHPPRIVGAELQPALR